MTFSITTPSITVLSIMAKLRHLYTVMLGVIILSIVRLSVVVVPYVVRINVVVLNVITQRGSLCLVSIHREGRYA